MTKNLDSFALKNMSWAKFYFLKKGMFGKKTYSTATHNHNTT